MAKLLELQLQHFRNLKSYKLTFGPRLNLIVGDNAAGKTSLIEAVWALSSGRSFRTAKPQQLIQHDTSELTLFAKVEQQHQVHAIGLSRSEEKVFIKVDGEAIQTQAELASKLPVQLLTPESHRLLEEGPKARRQYLDWGCFHQSQPFINAWRHYQRALKQRNHGLKSRLPKEQIELWNAQLIETAHAIDQIREKYVEDLSPYLTEFCQALMPELTVLPECHFRTGWSKSAGTFAQALASNFPKDLQQGHTQYGCHRADIKFRFDGQDALMKLSRGQQKLFVCALLLAQASLYEKTANEAVIMLIDDLPAELDAHHRETLLKLLQALDIQHILTSTDKALIPLLDADNAKVWQLENGQFSELLQD